MKLLVGVAGMVLALVLAAAAPLASAAALEGPRNLQVRVDTGSTDHFGGGDWVRVQAGQTTFAVLYGTPTNPNGVVILGMYPRYIGGAIVVDERGQVVRRVPIPAETVFAQRFDALVEFRRTDYNHTLADPDPTYSGVTYEPLKVVFLHGAPWSLEGLRVTNATDGSTHVDFNITARDVPYALVAPGTPAGDGVVEEIALGFHIVVTVHTVTVTIPIYRVTVDASGNPVRSEAVGNRTFTGPAVTTSFKYDHIIQGWDFAGSDSHLALATHLLFGTRVSERVATFLHLQFHPSVDDAQGSDEGTTTVPHTVVGDRLVFGDEWSRVGRLTWTSQVLVDGQQATMAFHVLGARRFDAIDGQFSGIGIVGAFVYPQGSSIVHDPQLVVDAAFPLTEAVNLLPRGLILAQVVLAVVALVGALVYRRRARA